MPSDIKTKLRLLIIGYHRNQGTNVVKFETVDFNSAVNFTYKIYFGKNLPVFS